MPGWHGGQCSRGLQGRPGGGASFNHGETLLLIGLVPDLFQINRLLSFVLMRKQVILRLEEGLWGRVEAARGDLPRQRWLVRAVELLLEEEQGGGPPLSMSEVAAAQRVMNEASAARLAARHRGPLIPDPRVDGAPVRREGESTVAFNVRKADWDAEQRRLSKLIDNS